MVIRCIPVVAFMLSFQLVDAQELASASHLQITILEGEGALNNIRQRTAREPIVEVDDENHKPVAGAAVLFSLPTSGPGGTFAGGNTLFNTVTGADGHAVGSGLIPNKVAGQYDIQVTAKYQNVFAHATIHQSNITGSTVTTTHAAAHTLSLKAALIVLASAGAIAATVVATQSGSSAAVITPGTPRVTAPPAIAVGRPK